MNHENKSNAQRKMNDFAWSAKHKLHSANTYFLAMCIVNYVFTATYSFLKVGGVRKIMKSHIIFNCDDKIEMGYACSITVWSICANNNVPSIYRFVPTGYLIKRLTLLSNIVFIL